MALPTKVVQTTDMLDTEHQDCLPVAMHTRVGHPESATLNTTSAPIPSLPGA